MPSATSQLLTTPVLYSKNQRKMSPANTSGSAHGSSRPSRTGHLTVNGLFASSASPSPTTSDARHRDDDVEDRVPGRMPEPLVVERARVVARSPPNVSPAAAFSGSTVWRLFQSSVAIG